MEDKSIPVHENSLLLPNDEVMLSDFVNGKKVGEFAQVTELRDQFSWKRTFVNCWTGNPNSGKTEFLNFMQILKSYKDDWVWCLWSPEMIDSYKDKNGDPQISASDIYDQLIHTYTGKNPYRHLQESEGIQQMPLEEYMEALEWVKGHFIVIHPKEKTYTSLIDTYKYFYDKYGFDGFTIDPFKNIRLPEGRTDEVLHKAFDELKECALMTDSSINIVAHPRTLKDSKNQDGSLKLVTQYDLLGGSAWNNSMDGIFSGYRPFIHKDSNDRRMWLFHLKQRKKVLVGNTGVYKKIEFDVSTNRYYFDGYCPIDGSYLKPVEGDGAITESKVKMPEQAGINFDQKELVNYESDDHDTKF